LYSVIENDNPTLHYPTFNTDVKKIEYLFIKNGLRKGKTVIISPFSNSEVSVSCEFWMEIRDLLRRIGYDVATMSSPDDESIPGTPSIFFDFCDTNIVLEYAGVFFGVRSGFCDIAMFSNCKKVILYFENDNRKPSLALSHINGGTIFEFASFEKMGFKGDYLELQNNYFITDDFMNKIEKYLDMEN
jgi:hypothetical protein